MIILNLIVTGFATWMAPVLAHADEPQTQGTSASEGIYQKLGFKSSDQVRTINNEEVDSPAKAMELYTKMKTDGDLTTFEVSAPLPVQDEEP